MTVAANPPQPTDKLSGLIDRVTYFSETTSFAVLKVKATGHRDLSQSSAPWGAGEWLVAEGTSRFRG